MTDTSPEFTPSKVEFAQYVPVLGRDLGPVGMSPTNPFVNLDWPSAQLGDPPKYWWGTDSKGGVCKVYRSYEDYCDD